MTTGRRSKQTASLKERITAWAEDVRNQAHKLAPGVERDALLRKANQADTAARLDDWVNSTGLQPPT
jgi:hypothetical protein